VRVRVEREQGHCGERRTCLTLHRCQPCSRQRSSTQMLARVFAAVELAAGSSRQSHILLWRCGLCRTLWRIPWQHQARLRQLQLPRTAVALTSELRISAFLLQVPVGAVIEQPDGELAYGAPQLSPRVGQGYAQHSLPPVCCHTVQLLQARSAKCVSWLQELLQTRRSGWFMPHRCHCR